MIQGMPHIVLRATALLATLAVPAGPACAEVTWLDRDKTAHFAVSIGAGAAGYLVAAVPARRPVHRLTGGAALGLLPGLAKEIYDATEGRRFSGQDLLFDALGALSGSLLLYALDRLTWDATVSPLWVHGGRGAAIVVTARR